MGENTQYLSFSAWFVLLGMMAPPSFAPLRMSWLFINDWLKFCRMYVARFLYSFVCWWTARLAPGFSSGKEQRKAWISECLCGRLTWGPSVGNDGGSISRSVGHLRTDFHSSCKSLWSSKFLLVVNRKSRFSHSCWPFFSQRQAFLWGDIDSQCTFICISVTV